MKQSVICIQLAFCVLFSVLSDVALGADKDKAEDNDYSEYGFSEEEVEKLRRTFEKIDVNRDGKITEDELTDIMKKLKKSHSTDKIQRLMDLADYDGDGVIDFEEFLLMTAHCKIKKAVNDELRMTFSEIDTDNDGLISPDELREYMKSLGEELTEEELNEMIDEADIDWDGMVNFKEFKIIMNLQDLIWYLEDSPYYFDDYYFDDDDYDDDDSDDDTVSKASSMF